MDRQILKGHTDVLILSAVSDQPMHGYAIMQSLRQASDDQFKFSAGMLYPMLYSLERRGFLESEWGKKAPARRRKCYRLTTKGKEYLAKKSQDILLFHRFIARALHV